jgi:hypothetical protein
MARGGRAAGRARRPLQLAALVLPVALHVAAPGDALSAQAPHQDIVVTMATEEPELNKVLLVLNWIKQSFMDDYDFGGNPGGISPHHRSFADEFASASSGNGSSAGAVAGRSSSGRASRKSAAAGAERNSIKNSSGSAVTINTNGRARPAASSRPAQAGAMFIAPAAPQESSAWAGARGVSIPSGGGRLYVRAAVTALEILPGVVSARLMTSPDFAA